MAKMNRSYRFLAWLMAGILINSVGLATTGLAQQGQTGPSGELSVVGEVTVNGTSAISGATVFSDSTITTAARSSAVVSLGKLGRVEVLPETTMKLIFDRHSIRIIIETGNVRVRTGPGITASISCGSV